MGKSKKKNGTDAGADALTYAQRSRLPLQSLYFLLPLIVAYEVSMFAAFAGGASGDIMARFILKEAGQWLGIGEVIYYLPGPLVAGALLGMHFAEKQRLHRDKWRFDPPLYGVMWLETLAWAMPILLFGALFFHAPAAQAATGEVDWKQQMVLNVGAGIYEELLFRLIGIAIVHAIMVDLLALPQHVGELTAIGLTAVLFAWYHFLPAGRGFDFKLFIFYTLAGVYLAWLYVHRGFGITAGTHAVYDVLVTLLAMWQSA